MLRLFGSKQSTAHLTLERGDTTWHTKERYATQWFTYVVTREEKKWAENDKEAKRMMGRKKEKGRENWRRRNSGGGSEMVTAVIDESHDRRMSHPSVHFTAQDHTHAQHTHTCACTDTHIPFELYSNLAAGIQDKDWVMFAPASSQPISRRKGVWLCPVLFPHLLTLRTGNTPPS